MQKKYNILIADPIHELSKALEQALKESTDLKLVGSTANGYEMIQLAKEHQPDVIILDILMQDLDGLQVLKMLRENKIQAKCIMLSCFYEDAFASRIQALGAAYLLVKPFSTAQLIEKIYSAIFFETVKEEKRPKMVVDSRTELWVTNALNEIGVPTHVAGYRYVRGSIILAAQDLEILSGITKELYPAIAVEFNTFPTNVDRSMRSAITAGWEKKNIEKRLKYLPADVANRKGRPSNGEFISALADRLRLQQKIWQEEAAQEPAVYEVYL